MNNPNPNPNPLIPQGSVLEQQSKGRSRIRVALFVVVALHVVFLGPLLIQGCKPESGSGGAATNASFLPPLDQSNLVDNLPPLETVGTSNSLYSPAGNQVGALPSVPATSPQVGQMTPAAVPERMDAATTTTHKIASGDTLGAIARKYHVSLNDLMAANPSANPTRLKINDTLIIPAPMATSQAPQSSFTPEGTSGETLAYKVKIGDNLTKIAKAHGTTITAIQSANGMRTTAIRAGQTLKIPSKSNSDTSAALSAPAMSPTASLAPSPASSVR
jgi:LysM repeat protein